VTFDGLEDQLLVDVINNQEPAIEERRDKLVVEIATGKNDLARLQNKILVELAESNADTILDNFVLIETLEICKVESTNVAARLEEAVQVEETINLTRNRYRSVAERGSILYFSIVEMAGVDSMYQNSLSYVKRLFNEAISQSRRIDVDGLPDPVEKEKVQKQNIDVLIQAVTKQLFEKICIGLFEAHKIIYAFLICSSIQRKAGLVDEAHWSYLLRGAGIFDRTDQPPKPECLQSFVPDAGWDLIYCLTRSAIDDRNMTRSAMSHMNEESKGQIEAISERPVSSQGPARATPQSRAQDPASPNSEKDANSPEA
jgi:dynein heavy chain